MNRYKVITTLTTHFEEIIEAPTEEKARDKYKNMIITESTDATEIWGGDFYINEILKED